MDERQLLAEGLETLRLPATAKQLEQFMQFSKILLQKNQVMNLTAITDPMEVITRHFLDSAVLSSQLTGRTIDIGTGAGFPGLPLAILDPDISFTLLDAQRKRIDFIKQVADTLGLKNVQPIHGRAEEFARQNRETFTCAVSRAVADLRVLSELCMPFVQPSGIFYAMKSQNCTEEVTAAEEAIALLGGALKAVEPYTIPCTEISHVLVMIQKITPTPAKYPRRFARIQAAPLGGK